MEELDLQFQQSQYVFIDIRGRSIILKRTIGEDKNFSYELIIDDVIVKERKHDQLKCLTGMPPKATMNGAFWVINVIKEMLDEC